MRLDKLQQAAAKLSQQVLEGREVDSVYIAEDGTEATVPVRFLARVLDQQSGTALLSDMKMAYVESEKLRAAGITPTEGDAIQRVLPGTSNIDQYRVTRVEPLGDGYLRLYLRG